VGPFAVNQGYANFYTIPNPTTNDEPIAILDANGFQIGGGIVALLPARLGLPTVDIAYLVTRDAEGDPRLDATQSGGGWDLSTNAPVSLVLAGLASDPSDPSSAPTVDVGFDLTSDAGYNINGGSLTISTALDLEPSLGIPLRLDGLTLDTGNGVSLVADLAVALPAAFGEHDLMASVAITQNGFGNATVTVGDPRAQYVATAEPVSEHTYSADLGAQ